MINTLWTFTQLLCTAIITLGGAGAIIASIIRWMRKPDSDRKQMGESRKGNTNNGITLIRCIETNEIYRTREWIKLGFQNAYQVAYGRQKTCKGMHFVIEPTD